MQSFNTKRKLIESSSKKVPLLPALMSNSVSVFGLVTTFWLLFGMGSILKYRSLCNITIASSGWLPLNVIHQELDLLMLVDTHGKKIIVD